VGFPSSASEYAEEQSEGRVIVAEPLPSAQVVVQPPPAPPRRVVPRRELCTAVLTEAYSRVSRPMSISPSNIQSSTMRSGPIG
jgi:hypothetical protein